MENGKNIKANLSPEMLELLAKRLKKDGKENKARLITRRTGTNGSIPASFAQQRLWFLNQFDPETPVYNIPWALQLNGDLDLGALQNAISSIVIRHESLRTTFGSENNRPVQIISAHKEVELPFVDLSESQGSALKNELDQHLLEEARHSFVLDKEWPIRFLLIKKGEQEYVLMITMNHIATDGWSMGVFYEEIVHFYHAHASNEDAHLPELDFQFADYASWQRNWLVDEVKDKQMNYWKNQLGANPPVLELPTDLPRPREQTYEGATREITLSDATHRQIKQLVRDSGASLYIVLLAAFDVLMMRYSGQEDFLVGTPVANRNQAGLEHMIGFFVNSLVHRANLSDNPTFADLIQLVKKTALESHSYQDLPFDQLVDELQLQRDLGKSPLFQVWFSLQNVPQETKEAAGVSFSPFEVHNGTSKFDISFWAYESPSGMRIVVEYNTNLFLEATIDAMIGHYCTILESAVQDANQPIHLIPILEGAERQKVLHSWNDTAVEYPRNHCIHQLFEEQVKETPNATALVYKEEELSYAALNAKANQLAHYLIEQDIKPDTLVGVYVSRSVDMMVAIMAILKAGGAYVPLDPDFPAERLAFMVEDAGIKHVISQERYKEVIPNNENVSLMFMDQLDADLMQQSTENPDTSVKPEHLSYVIYTSGSTGRPKGVMVEHRNVVNFFAGMDAHIPHDPPGVWLAVTSLSFDISVLELFWTLCRGFKVVMYSPEDERESPLAEYTRDSANDTDKKLDLSLFYFSSDESASGSQNKYRLLLEGAKFADENGFSAVWTPERHFHAFGGLYPNPAVTGAAVAAITKNVQIRSGSCVAPLHHSIRIAEEWSVVDNISNGRTGLSIASGWQPNDFVLKPDNFEDRRDSMFDQIDEIKALWRGESLTFTNGVGEDVAVSTLPRPVQKELPIWITAAANPTTFRMAGLKGYNLLTHLLGQSLEVLAEKVSVYRDAWEEAGHPGKGTVSLMLHTFLGESDEAVKEIVRGPMKQYLKSSVGLVKLAAEVPIFKQKMTGADVSSTIDRLTEEEMDQVLDFSFERYYDGSGLFGTVETCARFLEDIKACRVDEIACLIDFGVDTDDVINQFPFLAQLREKLSSTETNDSSTFTLPRYSVAGLVKEHGVSHLQCTPSMASMLYKDDQARNSLNALGCMMVGGEAFPLSLARSLSKVVPGKLLNMYGPTETTIWSAVENVTRVEDTVYIGRPIANTQIFMLDRFGQPVPPGVPGELCIGGDGVVRGYLNRPSLTEERFPNSVLADGKRIYKTGDLARHLKDGTLEFLGRLDFQVKIRGYRIELGEIESLLTGIDAINEAVVIVREDVPGDQRIVAYLISDSDIKPDSLSIRNALSDKLPSYMIPSHFVFLDEYPLTPNKKVDRKALPEPVIDREDSNRKQLPPENELENKIAEIWQRILNVKNISMEDNFFDLGGHSLLALEVHLEIKSLTEKSLSVVDLFRYPTIRSMAKYMGSSDNNNERISMSQKRGEARRRNMRRLRK